MKKTMAAVVVAVMTSAMAQGGNIVGTVNGSHVTKAEIDKLIAMVSPKGDMSWDSLSKEKKEELLKMIAPTKIMVLRAKKELTAEEKEAAIAGFWMQKKLQATKVTDDEIKKAYETVKTSYLKRMGGDTNKTAMQFPPLQMLKPQIEMKLKQDKIIKNLMKDAKVEVK